MFDCVKDEEILKEFFDFHESNDLKISEESNKVLKDYIDFLQNNSIWPLSKNKTEADAVLAIHKKELIKFQELVSKMILNYEAPWYKRFFSFGKKTSEKEALNPLLECSPDEFQSSQPNSSVSIFEDWKMIKNFPENKWLNREATDDEINKTDYQCIQILTYHQTVVESKKNSSEKKTNEASQNSISDSGKRNVGLLVDSSAGKKGRLEDSKADSDKKARAKKEEEKDKKNEKKENNKQSKVGQSSNKDEKSKNTDKLTHEELLKLKAISNNSESLKKITSKKNVVANSFKQEEEKAKLPSPPSEEKWRSKTLENLKKTLNDPKKMPEDYFFSRAHLDKGAIDLKLKPEEYRDLLDKWDSNTNYVQSDLQIKSQSNDNFQSLLNLLRDDYLKKVGDSSNLAELLLTGKGNEKAKSEIILATITDAIQSQNLKLPPNTSIGIQRYPGGETRPVLWRKDTGEVFDLLSGEKQESAKVDVEHPAVLTVNLLSSKEARELLPDEKRILLKAKNPTNALSQKANPIASPAPKPITPKKVKAADLKDNDKDEDNGFGFNFKFMEFMSNIGSFLKELPELLEKFGGRVTMKDIIEGLREVMKNPDMAKMLLDALKDEKMKKNLLDQLDMINPEDITPELKDKIIAKLKENKNTKGKEKLYEKMLETLEGPYGMAALREAASMHAIGKLDFSSANDVTNALIEVVGKNPNDGIYITAQLRYSSKIKIAIRNSYSYNKNGETVDEEETRKNYKKFLSWFNTRDGKKELSLFSPLMQAEILRRLKEQDFDDLNRSMLLARGAIPNKENEFNALKGSGLAFGATDLYEGGYKNTYTPSNPAFNIDDNGLPQWTINTGSDKPDSREIKYYERTLFFADEDDAIKFNTLRTDFEKAHFLFNLAKDREGKIVKEETSALLNVLNSPEKVTNLSLDQIKRIENLNLNEPLKNEMLKKSIGRVNKYFKTFDNTFPEKYEWDKLPAIGLIVKDAGQRIDKKSEELNKKWADNPESFIELINKLDTKRANAIIKLAAQIAPGPVQSVKLSNSKVATIRGERRAFSSESDEYFKSQLQSGQYVADIEAIGLTGRESKDEKKKVNEVKGSPKIVLEWRGKAAKELEGKRKQDAIAKVDPIEAQKKQEAMKSIFGDPNGINFEPIDNSKAKFKIHPEKWIELNKVGFDQFKIDDKILQWSVENKGIKDITLKQLFNAGSDQVIPLSVMDKKEKVLVSKNAGYVMWLKYRVCNETASDTKLLTDLNALARENNWNPDQHSVLCP